MTVYVTPKILANIFSKSNLSILPSTNPGSGKPWIDLSGLLRVGAGVAGTVPYIPDPSPVDGIVAAFDGLGGLKALGYVPVNKAGDTMSGLLITQDALYESVRFGTSGYGMGGSWGSRLNFTYGNGGGLMLGVSPDYLWTAGYLALGGSFGGSPDSRLTSVSSGLVKLTATNGTTLGKLQLRNLQFSDTTEIRLDYNSSNTGYGIDFLSAGNEMSQLNLYGWKVCSIRGYGWASANNLASAYDTFLLRPAAGTVGVYQADGTTLGSLTAGTVSVLDNGIGLRSTNVRSVGFGFLDGYPVAGGTMGFGHYGEVAALSSNGQIGWNSHSGVIGGTGPDTILKRAGVANLGVYAANGTTLGTLQATRIKLSESAYQTDLYMQDGRAAALRAPNGYGLYVDGWGQTAIFDLLAGPLSVWATNGLEVKGALGSGWGPISAHDLNITGNISMSTSPAWGNWFGNTSVSSRVAINATGPSLHSNDNVTALSIATGGQITTGNRIVVGGQVLCTNIFLKSGTNCGIVSETTGRMDFVKNDATTPADITAGAATFSGAATATSLAIKYGAVSPPLTQDSIVMHYSDGTTGYNNLIQNNWNGTQAYQYMAFKLNGGWGTKTPLTLYGDGNVEFAAGAAIYIPVIKGGEGNIRYGGAMASLSTSTIDASVPHLSLGYSVDGNAYHKFSAAFNVSYAVSNFVELSVLDYPTGYSAFRSWRFAGDRSLTCPGDVSQCYSSTTPSARHRMVATGQRASEVGDGAGTWLTMIKETYSSGKVEKVIVQSALDPTTSDVTDGFKVTWKNTASGEIRDWVNDGGSMKKSAAYT